MSEFSRIHALITFNTKLAWKQGCVIPRLSVVIIYGAECVIVMLVASGIKVSINKESVINESIYVRYI